VERDVSDDRLDAIKRWSVDSREGPTQPVTAPLIANVRWLVAQLEDARADADRLADEIIEHDWDHFDCVRADLAAHEAAVQRRGEQ
jgi:hypothetical protein